MTPHPADDLLPCETDAPEATFALGRALAERLRPGDVVALYGELGAGKTHLVKGVAAGLGFAPDAVTSPTFTIVNEYAARLPVHHVDAYRIERLDEFHELGYEDFFYGDGVCLVEWPSRIEPLLPPDALRLRLSHVAPTRRRFERVEAPPDAP